MTNPPLPTTEQPNNCQIFVGNLPFSLEWQDLKDMFGDYGTILHSDIAKTPSGKSRGFATVLFATPEMAQHSLIMDGAEVDGRQIKVKIDDKNNNAKPALEKSSPALRTVSVANIPFTIGWQDLKVFSFNTGSLSKRWSCC